MTCPNCGRTNCTACSVDDGERRVVTTKKDGYVKLYYSPQPPIPKKVPTAVALTLIVLLGCYAANTHVGHWVKNNATQERGIATTFSVGADTYYEVRLPNGNIVEWRPAEIVHDPDCPCRVKAEAEP